MRRAVLDAVRLGEAEIFADIGSDLVGIEDDRVQTRRQRIRQCGLSRAGKAHDQEFFHDVPRTFAFAARTPISTAS